MPFSHALNLQWYLHPAPEASLAKSYKPRSAPSPVSEPAEHKVPLAGAGNAAANAELERVLGGGAHTVERGDTLWRIADGAYGNGALWSQIRDANPAKTHRGGDLIYVGEVLDIPTLSLPVGGDTEPEERRAGGATEPMAPQFRTTAFGEFEVYADDFVGPLPDTQDAIQVVRESTFKAYAAEAASQKVNEDIADLEDGVTFHEAVVVTIAGQQVEVRSKAEAFHARRIIRGIKDDYGIKVDSAAGVEAITKSYNKVPKSELDKLKTTDWKYKELLALHNALSHFAPILGASRTHSSRKGVDQEISSVSKVDQAIDKNASGGKLDTTTLGEFFKDSKNFAMFTAGTDSDVDFAGENGKQLEGTAVHEIAHGLLKSHEGAYVSHLDYWTDKYTKSGKAAAEAPITSYGQKNAGEDLSEATMYFFVERSTLTKQCPVRDAWLAALVASWSKEKT